MPIDKCAKPAATFPPAVPCPSVGPAQVSGVLNLDMSGPNDPERELFDGIAQENVAVTGTDIDYYSQSLSKAKRDPLYDEPIETAFAGPFKMTGVFSFPERTPEASETGFRTVWTSSVWIPRKSFEDNRVPAPMEGDVICVWKNVFFDKRSVDDAATETGHLYFDVTKVDTDGHMYDSPSFVAFKLEVKRRTEFNPERRLGG